jgi:hypothetical protein
MDKEEEVVEKEILIESLPYVDHDIANVHIKDVVEALIKDEREKLEKEMLSIPTHFVIPSVEVFF